MFKGLDDGGSERPKKTIKPLIKFNYKSLAKKKRSEKTGGGAEKIQRRIRPGGDIRAAAVDKIKQFCDLVQAGDLEKARLTEYVVGLKLRGADIELNARSTSQLETSKLIRTERDTKTCGKRKVIVSTEEPSALFWIFSIFLDTDRQKKAMFSKKKDTITLSIPSVPEEQVERRLMCEYLIFKLWLVVRYVFTSVLTEAVKNPCVLVPVFIVKLDKHSTMGRIVREQLFTSYRREVKDLKSIYRCSFV